MFLQIMTYVWILSVVAVLIFLMCVVLRLLYETFSGKPIQWSQKYSFKWLPKFAIVSLTIATSISVVVYWSTTSIEVTISIYAFMMACIVAGLIRSSLQEYQIKRRGGEEI